MWLFHLAVVTGVHLIALALDVSALLVSGSVAKPVRLDETNVVFCFPVKDEVRHDLADDWALHDAVSGTARTMEQTLHLGQLPAQRLAVGRKGHDARGNGHGGALVD